MPYIIRKKEGRSRVVILPYAALYYWLIWPAFLLSFVCLGLKSPILSLISILLWVVVIGMAVPYWPIVFNIKKLMKKKSVSMKGSKYSLKNPLRYEWKS